MGGNRHPHIDGYRILRVIGHGGMSTVYLAEQESLGRKVALKVMLTEALADEVSRARFENEARTIARLEHPNIVGIHEVGRTSDAQPFYSMPYLARGHLGQRNLVGDQPRVAAILRVLLDALDYAHVRGVVHRDVKAENVLFDDADRPMLADFGIALRRGSNPRLTNTGLAVGSTAYMPPEQARGAEVDRRADLYSIGVLTWEMLVGRLPYAAGDALSMALKHVQDPIPRLPAPLRHWQGFIDKAMAKRAEDRYPSAREMLDALAEIERRASRTFTAIEVPPPSAIAETPKATGWRAPALVVAILAIIGLGVGYAVNTRDAAPTVTGTAVDAAAPAATATDLPAPADDARTGVLAELGDPAMPAQSVSAYIANAQEQLRRGRLLAPPNANAWDSLEAAWRANPTHQGTLLLTATVFDELSAAADRAMRVGNVGDAKLAFQRAQQLDARRGGTGVAIVQLRQRLAAATDHRVQALLAQRNPRAASLLLADLDWLGLDAASRRDLQAKVPAIAPTTTVTASAQEPPSPVEITTVTVSRADYARFASASGRKAAFCGNRLFGRKRAWNNVGKDGSPVTCVSAADAQEYAAWRSQDEGRRYRLPSAGELRAQPTAPVSGWVTLCADSACSKRMASGKPQALDASRGYEDVGIRLVQTR